MQHLSRLLEGIVLKDFRLKLPQPQNFPKTMSAILANLDGVVCMIDGILNPWKQSRRT